MTINRRDAIGALAAASAAAGTATAQDAVFAYGVASGDPAADGLLIWTHAAAPGGRAVSLRWEVAQDRAFRKIVQRGGVRALPSRDNTAKVVVHGLKPGLTYFYRFSAGKTVSPVGQARTLPVGRTDSLVLASACCAMFQGGYFNGYEAIANLPRVDAVLHLGDYIYEVAGEKPADYGYDTGVALKRLPEPSHACVTLADYRARFAQARRDVQLQAAHARAAWICMWDDHDLANDDWRDGAQGHNPATEGPWTARKAAAVQAFYEWMPIREPAPGAGFYAINRSFDFGDLACLAMLETRLTARDHQMSMRDLAMLPNGQPDVAAFNAKLADPTRRMMSDAQERWLGATLQASLARGQAWQILGSGVGMARVRAPDLQAQMSPQAWAALNTYVTGYYKGVLADNQRLTAYDLTSQLDAWDGYPAARERVYALIREAKARCLVLSGDSHMAWVNDLHDDAGRRVAAEFGATALTSGGFGDSLPPGVPLGDAFVRRNPEVVFNDPYKKGFVLLTLSRSGARGELIGVSTVLSQNYQAGVIKAFKVVPEGDSVSRPTPL